MKQIALAGFFGAIIISQFAWPQWDRTVESRGILIPHKTVPPPPSLPTVTKTPSPGEPSSIPYPNVGSARLPPDLASISTMLAEGNPESAILDVWKRYVTQKVQSRQPLDVDATLQQVVEQAQMQLKGRINEDRNRLDDKMNMMGDDGQPADVEMQNILQKQQQTQQMMSNISKMLHDTAMAVIRKIGG